MARRLVFSGGEPLAESLEAAPGLHCVIWPGGSIELELSPAEYLPDRQAFSRGGFSFMLEGGREPVLQCEGRRLCALPEGAGLPELHSLRDSLALLGACQDGMYLLTADARMQGVTGFLCAKEIELRDDGGVRSLAAPGDLLGHAVREEWQLTPGGLMPVGRSPAWEHGAPRWPQSPEDSAIAAVEAALAGQDEEAEAYLTPRLRACAPLAGIGGRCELCVRMKYAPPDSAPCVGLLKLEGGSLARVSPLYYTAVPSGRQDFPFLLERLEYA